MRYLRSGVYLIVVVTTILLATACNYLPRNQVPLTSTYQAVIPGMENMRYWSGKSNKDFVQDLVLSFNSGSIQDQRKKIDVLALSGGGHNGAFGAGVLASWSKTGRRPTFKVVTGISAGAIIGPFAFLGKDYDVNLKKFMASVSPKSVYKLRVFSFLWKDSISDSAPLYKLIKRSLTREIIDKIAEEHRKGRRLYIGTANLDADQLVVWNMGAIANSNHPGSHRLFRRIILASASIPAAFPPVMIRVKIGDNFYDEMHVDGGIKEQLFVLATTRDLVALQKHINLKGNIKGHRKIKVHVIRNGTFRPSPAITKRRSLHITWRSLQLLIKSQALADLTRIYLLCKENNVEFQWIGIPKDYAPSSKTEFDRKEMTKLFETGYQVGMQQNSWKKSPPGFN